MDIAALSTSMAMIDTTSQVGTRVLAMSLDDLRETGSEMQKMLEMSVNPNLGGNIDISV